MGTKASSLELDRVLELLELLAAFDEFSLALVELKFDGVLLPEQPVLSISPMHTVPTNPLFMIDIFGP